jgi:quinol monooxygenase YgiN
MFRIFATIKIKPDQRDGFLGTIRETAFRSVSGEPGCMRFDVFQDLADENRYILYEVYTDEKAFKEHLATSHRGMNSNPAISYGGGLRQILARLFGGDEGKRIMAALPHLLTAAFGTKRTSRDRGSMSAFGGKADIGPTLCNVCF